MARSACASLRAWNAVRSSTRGFAQAAGLLSLLMLHREQAAALPRGGGRVAEVGRFELLWRGAGVEGADGFAVRAPFVGEASVELDAAVGEFSRLQRSAAGELLDRQECRRHGAREGS